MQVVRDELADDPIVDITTNGRRTGEPRRIEIWMLDVDGRFFITGTPGPRAWLANLRADPRLIVHLKRRAHVDLAARATEVTDGATRRLVLEHLAANWYRSQTPRRAGRDRADDRDRGRVLARTVGGWVRVGWWFRCGRRGR